MHLGASMLHLVVRTFLFGVAASLTLLICMTVPGNAEKRIALVIGNSAYRDVAGLPNPANDAAAIAEMFKAAGFDFVDIRENTTLVELRRAVGDFAGIARGADVAVVYFAGHGMEVDGTNYVVPIDAKLKRDFDVEDETLAIDRVLKALEPARRLRLVILDACRDNPFAARMQRTVASRSTGRGLARIEPTVSDTLIAYAAKAGTTADDGIGAHSPFAEALLRHLTTPGLDLRIAFGRVRDDVLKSTGNRQEPFVYGSLGGADVLLNPAGTAAAAAPASPAAVAPPSDDPVQREYTLATQLGTAEAYDTFLARNPTGFFADLVRTQKAKLALAAPQVRQADPRTDSRSAPEVPVAFNDFRGQTFEVTFHQAIHEVSPRNVTWGLVRRYSFDVNSEQEIVTKATLMSDWNGAVRTFERNTPLAGDQFPKWEMNGAVLGVTFRERDWQITKVTLKRDDRSCTATAAIEPIPGRRNYSLN